MNYSNANANSGLVSSENLSGEARVDKVDEFVERFKTALSCCVQKGFHVEDCFGAIWDETLQEIELACQCRSAVYHQLISWANSAPKN